MSCLENLEECLVLKTWRTEDKDKESIKVTLLFVLWRELFKVYQLNKGATLARQLTTFHGKKEPGSASIKLHMPVTRIFVKVIFLEE